MSTWSKGARIEKKYCEKLEKDGWMTRRWNKTRFGEQDVWGVDIIAKKLGYTLWVQVKSSSTRMPAVLKKDIKELKLLSNHCEPSFEKVMWVGYNGKTKEWKTVEV